MSLLPTHKSPDLWQRLAVLKALHRLGETSDLNLTRFLTDMDVMNYFDMMFALNDLCDQGLALCTQKNGLRMFSVTRDGISTFEMFANKIPASLNEKIDAYAEQYRVRYETENAARADYEKTAEGWVVHLAVCDRDTDLVKIDLNMPTQELARFCTEQWSGKAQQVYAAILSLLQEEKE